jgi:hypothetical protein
VAAALAVARDPAEEAIAGFELNGVSFALQEQTHPSWG